MPRIPIYNPDVAPVQQKQADPYRTLASDTLGKAFGDLNETAYKVQAQNEMSNLHVKAAQTQADLANQYTDLMNKADPSDPKSMEAVQNFQKDVVVPTLSALDQDLITPDARRAAREQAADMASHFSVVSHTGQAELQGLAAKENYDKATNTSTSLLVNNPDMFEATVQQHDQAVKSFQQTGHLKASDAIQARNDFGKTATYSAVDGYINSGRPQRALDLLQGGAFDEYVLGPEKAALITKAEEALRGQTDGKNSLALDMARDAAKQFAITGQSPNAAMVNPDYFASLAPRDAKGRIDPGAQYQLRKEATEALAAGKEVAASKGMSFSERTARVAQLQSDLGGSTNFAADSVAAQTAEKVLRQDQEDFKASPTAYVAQRDAGVAQAWANYAKSPTPQNFQAAAAVSMARQAEVAGGNPRDQRVLPDAIVQGTIKMLQSSDGQPVPAEQAVKTLGQLQQLTGPMWPQAVRDLRDKKVLSDSQYVAANVMASGKQPEAAARLLQADAFSLQDLSKSLEAQGVKGAENIARTAASSALSDLLPTLADTPQVYDSYVEALTKLELYNQKMGIKSNAVDDANKLILGDYQFRGAMRIPNDINAGAAASGAYQIQADLDQLKVVLPPSRIAGRPEDEARRDYQTGIAQGGRWVTSSGDGGAELRDTYGAPVYEQGPDGRPIPIKRSWDQLVAKAPPPIATRYGGLDYARDVNRFGSLNYAQGALPKQINTIENSPANKPEVIAQGITNNSSPAEVKTAVRAAADKFGVPQHIGLALIEQETGFTPSKVSPTGAKGLGQLTKGFVKDYGEGQDPNDPAQNLEIAMRGLSKLKARYGTWELALKHYGDAAQTSYSSEVMAKAAKYEAQ